MPDENKNAIKNAINLSFLLIILTFYLILLDFTLIQRTLYADKVNQFYKTIKVIGNKINVSADITLSIHPQTEKRLGLCGSKPSVGRGGDLLSRFRSTIGAARFNFSVRNG